MPTLGRRLTDQLRRLFKHPLQRAASVINHRADIVLTTILRRELALHERGRQRDLILDTLLREVVVAVENGRRESHQSDLVRDAMLCEIVAAVENTGQEARQNDLVHCASLREVVAVLENAGQQSRQSDLVQGALLREIVRLQRLVEELLARQDQCEAETEAGCFELHARGDDGVPARI
jgi:hypothetical protein